VRNLLAAAPAHSAEHRLQNTLLGKRPMNEAHSFKNNSSQYREFMIIGIASQY